MRQPRRISAEKCYHLCTRIAHRAFLFDDVEKNLFVDLLFRAVDFSCVDLLGFCCMSNHVHIFIYLPPDRELTEDEILKKVQTLYVGFGLQEIMDKWNVLKEEDERLKALPGGKPCASDFDGYKLSFQRRMFNPSEFMKTLKQHFTMSYNRRKKHVGTLWESRFTCKEVKPETPDMARVLSYIDCNPVQGGICTHPLGYQWCGWSWAKTGHEAARQMYQTVYENVTDKWDEIVEVHEDEIRKRIGEIEEEKRQGKLSGAKRRAPAGESPLEAPKEYQVKIVSGRSDLAEAILELLSKGEKSAGEIGLALGMKSRYQLTSVYMRQLLEAGLVELTIPENPRAMHQKYRLKA